MTFLDIVLNNLIYLVPLFSLYYVFRKLNFHGMRKEWAFDVSILYLLTSLIFLKLIYLYQNFQNYSSFYEILWNLNLPTSQLNFIFLFNFIFALNSSRVTRFSLFRILDALTINLLVILAILNFKSSEIGLICFVLFCSYFLEKKFKSGFVSFLTIFAFTNYFLLYPKESNSLIFYIILNTINALFTYRRIKFMTHTLSQEFIAQCKEKLLQRKKDLLEDLQVIDQDVDLDRDTGNAEYLDEVQEDLKVEKNYIFKKDVQQMLDSVNAALHRIDEGTYGFDKKTGEPIDPARLELFPESDENVK